MSHPSIPPFLASVIARLGDLAPGIVGAVAADVDHAPCGIQTVFSQELHRLVDASADRGATPEGTRRGGQSVGEGLGPRPGP